MQCHHATGKAIVVSGIDELHRSITGNLTTWSKFDSASIHIVFAIIFSQVEACIRIISNCDRLQLTGKMVIMSPSLGIPISAYNRVDLRIVLKTII